MNTTEIPLTKIDVPTISKDKVMKSPKKRQSIGNMPGTYIQYQQASEAISHLEKMIAQINDCNRVQNSMQLTKVILPINVLLVEPSINDLLLIKKFQECVLKIQNCDWGKSLCEKDPNLDHALKFAKMITAKQLVAKDDPKSMHGDESSRSSESNVSGDKKSKTTPHKSKSVLDSLSSCSSLLSSGIRKLTLTTNKDANPDPKLVKLFDGILSTMNKVKLYPDIGALKDLIEAYAKCNPTTEAINLVLDHRSKEEHAKIYFLLKRTFWIGSQTLEHEKGELVKLVEQLKTNPKNKDDLEKEKKRLESELTKKYDTNNLVDKIVKSICIKNTPDKTITAVEEYKEKVRKAKLLGEDIDEICRDPVVFPYFLDFLLLDEYQPDIAKLLEQLCQHEKESIELQNLTGKIVNLIMDPKSKISFTGEEKKVACTDALIQLCKLFNQQRNVVKTMATDTHIKIPDYGNNVWNKSWYYYLALLQKKLPLPYTPGFKG